MACKAHYKRVMDSSTVDAFSNQNYCQLKHKWM